MLSFVTNSDNSWIYLLAWAIPTGVLIRIMIAANSILHELRMRSTSGPETDLQKPLSTSPRTPQQPSR
jgi:hypothetical protein